MRKAVVGVIGASEREGLTDSEKVRLRGLAEAVGTALARRQCILITGATTGLPDLVARAFRNLGGFSLGISPGASPREHVERYGLPEDASDAIVYTGFGLKGRNVITVRSADIVIIFGGAMGTLNEFTIAYDEGKIVGVLEGSGGIADHMQELIGFVNKPTVGRVWFDKDPENLVQRCFEALSRSC